MAMPFNIKGVNALGRIVEMRIMANSVQEAKAETQLSGLLDVVVEPAQPEPDARDGEDHIDHRDHSARA